MEKLIDKPLGDMPPYYYNTHWGRVTHICVGKQTIIGSDNGLSPGRRQAIIWTNAGLLLIGPVGTNFSETSIKIITFSFTKMRLKVSSAKWRPFCLGLNVLNRSTQFQGTLWCVTPVILWQKWLDSRCDTLTHWSRNKIWPPIPRRHFFYGYG